MPAAAYARGRSRLTFFDGHICDTDTIVGADPWSKQSDRDVAEAMFLPVFTHRTG
jgi:hypothetical protein